MPPATASAPSTRPRQFAHEQSHGPSLPSRPGVLEAASGQASGDRGPRPRLPSEFLRRAGGGQESPRSAGPSPGRASSSGRTPFLVERACPAGPRRRSSMSSSVRADRASRPFLFSRLGYWTRTTAASSGRGPTPSPHVSNSAANGEMESGSTRSAGTPSSAIPGFALRDAGGSVARIASSRSAVIRFGGRSVSGYIRSGPGGCARIRWSRPGGPGASPRDADRRLLRPDDDLLGARAWRPASGPQTTTTVSSSPAPRAFLMACHSALERVSLGLSEWMMLGRVVRQAMTRTRSEISW